MRISDPILKEFIEKIDNLTLEEAIDLFFEIYFENDFEIESLVTILIYLENSNKEILSFLISAELTLNFSYTEGLVSQFDLNQVIYSISELKKISKEIGNQEVLKALADLREAFPEKLAILDDALGFA